MNISDEMLKNIKSEVKKQLKEERVNTATLKRDITIKINDLDEQLKTLFRGYIQGKCDEKMYNELKTEIELEKEKLQNCIFNIIIVDEITIRDINKNYRDKDSVTDVISFALEDDKLFIKTDYRILGDIYICLDRAKSQAIEYGHSFLREFAFLTIHGLLHLLGYDHMTKEEEEIMFKLQEMILDEYGIKR